MWCIYRERNKGEKKGVQRSCDRCKGEGGEGVANGHMTVGGQGGRGRGRGEEERGPGRPATLGPSGPPLWTRRPRHSGPIGPSILGSSSPPPGPVRPVQYKARRLVVGRGPNLIGPARSARPVGDPCFKSCKL